MTQENELEIIGKLTGVKDCDRIRLNGVGWASRVYMIDAGRIVFKFPRNEEARSEYGYEVAALRLLAGQFEHIPKLKWADDNGDYMGFYGVMGDVLDVDLVRNLSLTQRREVGASVGRFVKKLHAVKPPEGARGMNLREELAQWQEMYRGQRNGLGKYWDADILVMAADLFERELPAALLNWEEDLVFSHGDLGYNNIVVMANGEAGVIDFGDAGVYERFKDLMGLKDDEMSAAALDAYGADEVLRRKVALGRKTLPFLELFWLMERGEEEKVTEVVAEISELVKSEL